LINIDVGLFLAHLIVTDNKIDIKTNQILMDYLKDEGDIRPEELQQINDVIENNDDVQPLEHVLRRLNEKSSTDDKEIAMSIGLALCLHKGFLSVTEVNFFKSSRKAFGITERRFNQLKSEVERGFDETAIASLVLERKQHELIQQGYVLPLKSLIDKYDSDERSIERSDAMMKDEEYASAISHSKEIGKGDMDFARPILHEHIEELHKLRTAVDQLTSNLKKVRNRDSDTTRSLIDASKNLQSQVHGIVQKRERDTESFLEKIENAADYFTISFLGKTKAGKSTLHAVLSGKGKQAIGVGRQRTTRNNRVYTWEGLRIIDTPGIGAPHGESDEEIAKSILDESDLICYVLKNDSVQEKEFEFLSLIKKRNKPILILLNVKTNLSTPARLRRFLRDPDYVYEREDEKSIKGHLNRIREYARKHYSNDIFEIIPVHLYASLLSQDKAFSESDRLALFDGSRLAHFENAIKESIVSQGHIRKSQTILNGCLNPILDTEQSLSHHLGVFETINADFNRFHLDSVKKFNAMKKKYIRRIRQAVDEEFLKVEEQISHFSHSNYDVSKSLIESRWGSLLEEIGFERGLGISLEKIQLEYTDEVQDYLSEMMENMKFANLLLRQKFSYDSSAMFDFRRMFGYVSAGLGVAAAIALFFSGPLGWGLTAASLVVGGIKLLFKSKKRKIQDAITSLSTELKKVTAKHNQDTKDRVEAVFLEGHDKISKETFAFQRGMMSTLHDNIKILSGSLGSMKIQQDQLNKAYAYRLMTAYVPDEQVEYKLNQTKMDVLVDQVERDFGKTITIHTRNRMDDSQLEHISNVIQEDIKIQTV